MNGFDGAVALLQVSLNAYLVHGMFARHWLDLVPQGQPKPFSREPRMPQGLGINCKKRNEYFEASSSCSLETTGAPHMSYDVI